MKVRCRIQKHIRLTLAILVAAGSFGFFQPTVEAAIPLELRLFDRYGEQQAAWKISPAGFRQGAHVVSAMFDTSGALQYALAPEVDAAPEVYLYHQDGSLIRRFGVLDKKFRGGVNLAAGDVDGDGVAELMVTAGPGGGPRVEVYAADGTLRFGFYAYQKKFRGGVRLASADLDGDAKNEIITISGYESPGHLRVFNHAGKPTTVSVFPFGQTATFGGTVTVADVDAKSPYPEIIVAPLGSGTPALRVLSSRGKALKTIPVFSEAADRGFELAAANTDADPEPELLVAPRQKIGQVRFYNMDGTVGGFLTPFGGSSEGSLSLAPGPDNLIAVVPVPWKPEGRTDLLRYIDINLTTQRLTYYRLGRKIAEEKVSTGKWSMQTPVGTFQTRNKISTAYSRRYDLYMDWWMAITPDGAYGIHALPYWALKGGGKLYEGENHLGTPVSHGCIRLGPRAAKALFDWAPIGTTVIIHT